MYPDHVKFHETMLLRVHILNDTPDCARVRVSTLLYPNTVLEVDCGELLSVDPPWQPVERPWCYSRTVGLRIRIHAVLLNMNDYTRDGSANYFAWVDTMPAEPHLSLRLRVDPTELVPMTSKPCERDLFKPLLEGAVIDVPKALVEYGFIDTIKMVVVAYDKRSGWVWLRDHLNGANSKGVLVHRKDVLRGNT